MKLTLLTVLLLATAATSGARPSSSSLDVRGNAGLSIGKSCKTSTQCASAYCGHAKCAAKQANGKACYKDAGCVSGLCKSGKCASPHPGRELGKACTASTQCLSGLCEHSKCASKKDVGGTCYKDVACLSGYCKDGKTCALKPTSTTTSSTTSSATITSAARPTLVDGDFTSLNAYQTSGSGSAVIVNDAATCNTGNTCVRVTIPAGGDYSIIQNTTPSARRRAALMRRQTGSLKFVSKIYRKVTAMSPIGVYNIPNSGLNANPQCLIRYCMNNDCSYGDAIADVSTEWGSGGGACYDDTLTSIGVKLSCEPGAQMSILIDSMSFIDTVAYASSESAGLSPSGFLEPTSPAASQPTDVVG